MCVCVCVCLSIMSCAFRFLAPSGKQMSAPLKDYYLLCSFQFEKKMLDLKTVPWLVSYSIHDKQVLKSYRGTRYLKF